MDGSINPFSTAVDLAPIAQQYGPFFFALLYTLMIPLLGQALIKRKIDRAGDISEAELNERIRSQRAYRTFAISMAGFCLSFSMFWWGYIQLYPPNEAIDKLVQAKLKAIVFQGEITGLSPDDILVSHDDMRYTSYVWTDTNSIPIVTKFVIVAKAGSIYDKPVNIYYGNQKTIAALEPMRAGYFYQPLPFCLNEAAIQMRMVRVTGGQPSLSNPCKAKDGA